MARPQKQQNQFSIHEFRWTTIFSYVGKAFVPSFLGSVIPPKGDRFLTRGGGQIFDVFFPPLLAQLMVWGGWWFGIRIGIPLSPIIYKVLYIPGGVGIQTTGPPGPAPGPKPLVLQPGYGLGRPPVTVKRNHDEIMIIMTTKLIMITNMTMVMI